MLVSRCSPFCQAINAWHVMSYILAASVWNFDGFFFIFGWIIPIDVFVASLDSAMYDPQKTSRNIMCFLENSTILVAKYQNMKHPICTSFCRYHLVIQHCFGNKNTLIGVICRWAVSIAPLIHTRIIIHTYCRFAPILWVHPPWLSKPPLTSESQSGTSTAGLQQRKMQWSLLLQE